MKKRATKSLYGLLGAFLARSALDDSQNLVLAHDQELLVINLDFRAAVLSKQNAVADANIQRLARPVFAIFAFADGDNLALLGLLFCGVGNDDPAANLLAFLNAPQNHAVLKWPNVYCQDLKMLLFSLIWTQPYFKIPDVSAYRSWQSRKLSANEYRKDGVILSTAAVGRRVQGV